GVFVREFWSRLVREAPPRWLFRVGKRLRGRAVAKTRYPRWFREPFRARALALQAARPIRPDQVVSRHAAQYYRHVTAGHYVNVIRRQKAAGQMRGMDVAYPFRDRDLVAFLMAIPGDIVNWRGVPKGLLRQSLTGILPDAIRDRRWKADGTPMSNDAARRDH